jgi:hypothetical protein
MSNTKTKINEYFSQSVIEDLDRQLEGKQISEFRKPKEEDLFTNQVESLRCSGRMSEVIYPNPYQLCIE